MSFREKSAWISVLTYLGVYGTYFWVVAGAIQAGHTQGLPFVGLLVKLMVLLVVLEIVLHVVLAIWQPKDAGAAEDDQKAGM